MSGLPAVYHRIDVATAHGTVFTEARSNDALFQTTNNSNQAMLFGSVFQPEKEPALVIRGTDATTKINRLMFGYQDDLLGQKAILDTRKSLNYLRGDIGNGSNAIIDWVQVHGGPSNGVVDIDQDDRCVYMTGTFGSNILYLYDRPSMNYYYTLTNSNITGAETSIYLSAYTASNGAYRWATTISACNPSHLEATAMRALGSNQICVSGTFEPSGQTLRFSSDRSDDLDLAAASNIPVSSSFLALYTYNPLSDALEPDLRWRTLVKGVCKDIDGTSNMVIVAGDQPMYSNIYVQRYDALSGSLQWDVPMIPNGSSVQSVRIQPCENAVYLATSESNGNTGLYKLGLSNGSIQSSNYFPRVDVGLDPGLPHVPKGTYMAFDANCDLYVLDSYNKTFSWNGQDVNPYLESNTNIATMDVLLSKHSRSNGSLMWFARGSSRGKDLAKCVFTNAHGDVYWTGLYQDRLDVYDGFGALHTGVVRESVGGSNHHAGFVCKMSQYGHFIYATQIEGVSPMHPIIGTCDSIGDYYIAGSQGASNAVIYNSLQTSNIQRLSRVANAQSEGFLVKYDQDSLYFLLSDELDDRHNGIELSFVNAPDIPDMHRRCSLTIGHRQNSNVSRSNIDPNLLHRTAHYEIFDTSKISFSWYDRYWRLMTRDNSTLQDLTVRTIRATHGWAGTGSPAGIFGGVTSSFTFSAFSLEGGLEVGTQLFNSICMPFSGRVLVATSTLQPSLSEGLANAEDAIEIVALEDARVKMSIRNFTRNTLSSVDADGHPTDIHSIIFAMYLGTDAKAIVNWTHASTTPYRFNAGDILTWEVSAVVGTIFSFPAVTMWVQFD